ncbi:MAG: lipocalin-like domain-containing protein [Chthoniobacterales bacterium]
MKHSLGILCLALVSLGADWKTAEPGWRYEFPRDHFSHPDFKTEWWYFTGNLFDSSGRRFGYELTFFRQGIRPPNERDPQMSRFVVGDLKFAHFTITDVSARRFRFEQKTSRGAFGESGFDDGDRIAWIDDWTLTMNGTDGFDLVAKMSEQTLHLQLRATKPVVVHGQNGISVKASAAGHASHYYSFTRLTTTGELLRGDRSTALRGESWFDHEWATNQLAPGQVGWDWLSVQFDDGGELMLYQMRLQSGAADPSSNGTLVRPNGQSIFLPSAAFRMSPTGFWQSEKTGAKYPVAWRIEIPQEKLELNLRPVLDNQELALMPLAYWEGAIDVEGACNGKPIKGRGYLELTGYAGALQELQR